MTSPLKQFSVPSPTVRMEELLRPDAPGVEETDWPNLTVLAFDQALANTGWVQIQFKTGHLPIVIRTGMIGTEAPDYKGHAANLRRSRDLFDQIRLLLSTSIYDLVVHEVPPVGTQMNRPESSLLAADAIWHATQCYGTTPVMIANQRAKTLLTGNRGASKRELRRGVLQHLPGLEEIRPANEHTYDAAALALTAAWEAPR